MPYLMLIHEPHGQREQRSLDEGKAAYAQMLQFGEGLHARGLLLASESLKPDAEGVRVRVRDGQRRLIDGPFTEAKEFVGGFFLLDCATRAEALEIATDCPAAQWATVEIREVAPCYT